MGKNGQKSGTCSTLDCILFLSQEKTGKGKIGKHQKNRGKWGNRKWGKIGKIGKPRQKWEKSEKWRKIGKVTSLEMEMERRKEKQMIKDKQKQVLDNFYQTWDIRESDREIIEVRKIGKNSPISNSVPDFSQFHTLYASPRSLLIGIKASFSFFQYHWLTVERENLALRLSVNFPQFPYFLQFYQFLQFSPIFSLFNFRFSGFSDFSLFFRLTPGSI